MQPNLTIASCASFVTASALALASSFLCLLLAFVCLSHASATCTPALRSATMRVLRHEFIHPLNLMLFTLASFLANSFFRRHESLICVYAHHLTLVAFPHLLLSLETLNPSISLLSYLPGEYTASRSADPFQCDARHAQLQFRFFDAISLLVVPPPLFIGLRSLSVIWDLTSFLALAEAFLSSSSKAQPSSLCLERP